MCNVRNLKNTYKLGTHSSNREIVYKNVYKETVLATVQELPGCDNPGNINERHWFTNLEVSENITLEQKENTNLEVNVNRTAKP